MAQHIKVFVSHSFEDRDKADVDLLLEILRKPEFHFDVRTGRDSEPTQIGRKISALIDWADVTFGLFTARFRSLLKNQQ